jgi:hypothetical protein
VSNQLAGRAKVKMPSDLNEDSSLSYKYWAALKTGPIAAKKNTASAKLLFHKKALFNILLSR